MLPNNEAANITVTLNPKSSPKLEDPRIEDVGKQALGNSVVEDSKQTKEESEKQISSQLGPKEVKQVQSEEQLSIAPLKKSVIIGNFIFKEELSHC